MRREGHTMIIADGPVHIPTLGVHRGVDVVGSAHSGRLVPGRMTGGPIVQVPDTTTEPAQDRSAMSNSDEKFQTESIAVLADGSPVGAWMLKANPAVWDIGAALEQGLGVDWWRLAHSYRAELVHRGHPCVLWITKGDPRVPSGIWGIGTVTGEPVDGSGDPEDPLWTDEVARAQIRPRIPVTMRILDRPVHRDRLRSDPLLGDLEILRVPRIGNPAAVTPDQWSVIEQMVT